MRVILLSLGLVVAILLHGFPGANWYAAGAAAGLAVVTYLYIKQGRWQAAPLLVIALGIVIVRIALYDGRLPIWVSALFLAAIAIVFAWLILNPIPHLSAPTGDQAVGLRRVELQGKRKIIVYVWYPARPIEPSKPRRYHSKAEAAALSTGMKRVGVPGFWHSHLKLARTSTYDHAPILPGSYPLVMFNHGGGLYPTQNFALMEELASQGYICVSVGHFGESAALLDGQDEMILIRPDLVTEMKGSDAYQQLIMTYMIEQDQQKKKRLLRELADHSEQPLGQLTRQWAQDTLDAVEVLTTDSDLEGVEDWISTIDRERIAYVGMSLGGSTSTLCGHLDKRAKAVVNLDGFNWDFELLDAPLRVPVLQCYGDPNLTRRLAARHLKKQLDPIAIGSNTLMYNDGLFEGAAQRVCALIFPGAGHMAFTDAVLGARPGMRTLMGLGSSASRSFSIELNDLVRHFLDSSLRDQNYEAFDARAAGLERAGVLVPQHPEH